MTHLAPPSSPRRRGLLVAALAAAAALAAGGCDWIHAATAGKLSSAQRSALADLLTQSGTIASVFADPTSATVDDLATSVTLDHFPRLTGAVHASAAARTLAAFAAAPAGLDCLIAEGTTTMVSGCQVPIGTLTCQVDGHATSTPDGAGNTRVTGTLALSGAGCPSRSVDFDFTLGGPTSSPTSLDGTVDFADHSPPTADYSGQLDFRGIGLAPGCTKPSQGKLGVTVTGTYGGASVDSMITLSFNATPECGVVLIE